MWISRRAATAFRRPEQLWHPDATHAVPTLREQAIQVLQRRQGHTQRRPRTPPSAMTVRVPALFATAAPFRRCRSSRPPQRWRRCPASRPLQLWRWCPASRPPRHCRRCRSNLRSGAADRRDGSEHPSAGGRGDRQRGQQHLTTMQDFSQTGRSAEALSGILSNQLDAQ